MLIVGAGGHARVCLEALEDSGYFVVGVVSRDGVGAIGLDVSMLGRDDDVAEVMRVNACERVFVAVGDNRARGAVQQRCEEEGFLVATAISRYAMLSRRAAVGEGAVLMPGATVNAATTVGRGVIVNTNASIDHDCTIGDYAHIAPGAAICGGVRIGDGVLIGVGASIAPGVVIGAEAVVGAGAAVVHDVAPGSTVVGVPARSR